MDIDRIISIIRSLKEDATVPANSANSAGLGFDPKTESPPVFDGRSKVARRLPPPYKSALINSKKKKK